MACPFFLTGMACAVWTVYPGECCAGQQLTGRTVMSDSHNLPCPYNMLLLQFYPRPMRGIFPPFTPYLGYFMLISYALIHQRQPESTEILLCYFFLSSRASRSAIIVFATTFWSSSSRCLKRRKTCSSPPASFTFDTSMPIR